MIITYFRNSSLGTLAHCEHKYYLNYVLGYESEGNLKAEKGNVLHKVMECLAQYKLALQNGDKTFFNDSFGDVNVINGECDPKVLLDKAYVYYKSQSKNEWNDKKDKEECWEWVNRALEFQNGRFDPRKNNIYQPEHHFDLEIPYEWAKYSFVLSGEKIEGNLRIKGTIDLIQKIDENAYEVIDYKTGSLRDWLTGENKTPEKLQKDIQLKLYYYAIRKLYPDIKYVILTIYYVNQGGPFTVSFNDNTLEEVEYYLKTQFNKTKGILIPRKNVSFDRRKLNCTWCDYFKKKNKDGINLCDEVHNHILRNGIGNATERYMNNSKVIRTYLDGGGSKNHGNKNIERE